MIGSAGSFWLLVLTSSSDANSALSHFGIVCRAVGNPTGTGGHGGDRLPFYFRPAVGTGAAIAPRNLGAQKR